MKKIPTLFLRVVIYLLGLAVLAACVFAIYTSFSSTLVGYYRPIIIGINIPAIPFYFGLYQSLVLLRNIDQNIAFSSSSVRALKIIKYSAAIIAGLYIAGLPYIYYAANRDDAPGVLAIGLVIVGAAVVVAVFASLLGKLFESAAALKSEQDLTV